MFRRKKYFFFRQLEKMDCGPTCLKMIAKWHGKVYPITVLRSYSNVTRIGCTMADIANAAQLIGFKALIIKISLDYFNQEQPFPCMLHWKNNHFVVFYGIRNSKYIIADPAVGLLYLTEDIFLSNWGAVNKKGMSLLLQPTEEFYANSNIIERDKTDIRFVKKVLSESKGSLSIVSMLLIIGALFSSCFPFLLKIITDQVIPTKQIHLLYLILIAQSLLYLGHFWAEWGQRFLLIRFATITGINIITQFLIKLISLPANFFDTKAFSDIIQKVDDQDKIKNFLNAKLAQSFFSVLLIFFLSIQLFFLSKMIFLLVIILAVCSIGWVSLFYKKHRINNYTKFGLNSDNRNAILELVNGMTEIKVNNAQDVWLGRWKEKQKILHGFEIKALKLIQYEYLGVYFFTGLRNIIITLICVNYVIRDQMSMGSMLAVSLLVGQISVPLEQLIDFFISANEARISLRRILEIQNRQSEEDGNYGIRNSNLKKSIQFLDVSFKYPGSFNLFSLSSLSFKIEKGTTIAIVGSSGSGKTTLLKILLGFYKEYFGEILIDNIDLKKMSPNEWRDKCGVVMQDGFIFSETVAQNIALSEKEADLEKVRHAGHIACIDEFVMSLPLQYNTIIGKAGLDLSGGQRQRILIARTVYKDPEVIFFDEATSSLDANTEKEILSNLEKYLKRKTVIIIAHRLSTVKKADQILVLEKGKLVEQGTHEQLSNNRGLYFELVRNQLEIEK